jgi:hypothetical protein
MSDAKTDFIAHINLWTYAVNGLIQLMNLYS